MLADWGVLGGNEVVGVTGFEPATSWSQTRRSTKLSYTPNFGDFQPLDSGEKITEGGEVYELIWKWQGKVEKNFEGGLGW